MAGKKISELISATELTSADLLTIVQDNENKKLLGADLISTLSNLYASNTDLTDIINNITDLSNRITDIYNQLSQAIIDGDTATATALQNSLIAYFNQLQQEINNLTSVHNTDVQALRDAMQLWIDVINGKGSLEQLQELLNSINDLQDQINALANDIADGGIKGDYEVTIYANSTVQPQRPLFRNIPGQSGASGPDNVRWYYDIPTGDNIWYTRATFSGLDDLAKNIDGNYWANPTLISGRNVYYGELDGSAFTVASDAFGNVSASEIASVRTGYRLKYGNDVLTYDTDYTIQIIQPDPTNTSTISNYTSTQQLWLATLDKNIDTTTFNVQFLRQGLIVTTSKLTITKSKSGSPGNYDALIYGYKTSTPSRPTFTTLPTSAGTAGPDGTIWYLSIPSGTPIWMCKATFDGGTGQAILVDGYYWTAPVKITGEDGSDGAPGTPGADGSDGADGADGTDGNFYSMWYTVSGNQPVVPTRTTIPTTSSFTSDGVTWYNTVQYSGSGDTWMTQALVSGGTTTIIGTWSTPIMVSGQIGQTTPTMTYRGQWSATETYYLDAVHIDIVYYGPSASWYYRSGNSATAIGDSQNPTNTSYWTAYAGNYESLATGLFFADHATIAGWQFYEDWIASQNGNVWLDGRTYNSSTGAGAYPISIGPNASTNPAGGLFTVDRNGALSSTSGKIGGFNIGDTRLYSDTDSNGAYIEMVNGSNGYFNYINTSKNQQTRMGTGTVTGYDTGGYVQYLRNYDTTQAFNIGLFVDVAPTATAGAYAVMANGHVISTGMAVGAGYTTFNLTGNTTARLSYEMNNIVVNSTGTGNVLEIPNYATIQQGLELAYGTGFFVTQNIINIGTSPLTISHSIAIGLLYVSGNTGNPTSTTIPANSSCVLMYHYNGTDFKTFVNKSA